MSNQIISQTCLNIPRLSSFDALVLSKSGVCPTSMLENDVQKSQYFDNGRECIESIQHLKDGRKWIQKRNGTVHTVQLTSKDDSFAIGEYVEKRVRPIIDRICSVIDAFKQMFSPKCPVEAEVKPTPVKSLSEVIQKNSYKFHSSASLPTVEQISKVKSDISLQKKCESESLELVNEKIKEIQKKFSEECEKFQAKVAAFAPTCTESVQLLAPIQDLSNFTVPFAKLPQVIESLSSPTSKYSIRLVEALIRNGTLDSSQLRRKENHEPPSFFQSPEQDYILAPLPTKESVAEYFRMCLKKNVEVLVSAHEIADANSFEYGKFWDQSVLSQLELDGWKLETKNVQILAVGTEKNQKGSIPQIVETTITATHKQHPQRVITHLHYEGYLNRMAAPNEQLLQILLDRMEEISPNPRNPIAINCHAGRGRTFDIAGAYFFRKKIGIALRKGEDLDQIAINLPEFAFQFGRCRDLDLRSIPSVPFMVPKCRQILSTAYEYGRSKSGQGK